MATIDEILGYPVEKLAAYTDEELRVVLADALAIEPKIEDKGFSIDSSNDLDDDNDEDNDDEENAVREPKKAFGKAKSKKKSLQSKLQAAMEALDIPE